MTQAVKAINAMDAFCDRNGIFKVWLAEGAGIPLHRYKYAAEYNAFTEADVAAIERFLHSKGRELYNFRFSQGERRQRAEIEQLHKKFGIRKTFLAKALNSRYSTAILDWATKRLGGFRKQEIEILEATIKEIAGAMISFEFPATLRKAA